jgi:type III pantothenate kinase
MIILVDLGNSALSIGVYEQQKCQHRFFTNSDRHKTAIEYQLILKSFLLETNYSANQCEAIVFCSVVPPLTPIVKQALEAIYQAPILMLGKKLKTGLALHVDHPSEVGADLVAASVGAITKYQAPCVIVDMGTATKIIAIDQKGAFVGVTIAPGLMVSLKGLIGQASQLSDVDLSLPAQVIGRNTVDAVNSGALYGHACLVEGLAEKVAKELNTDKPIILTGGYSKLVRELLPKLIYDENLLFDGLLTIYNKNRSNYHEKQ